MPIAKRTFLKSRKVVRKRKYDVDTFRTMLKAVLRGCSAKGVATDVGFPSAARSLKRYAQGIRKHPELKGRDAEATLAMRLCYAERIELKDMGNPYIHARKIFSAAELEYFESFLILCADMGFPYQWTDLQQMMLTHVKETNRIDWTTGKLFVVSASYVFNYMKKSPRLKTYKTSAIDVQRTKKATMEVNSVPSE